MRPTTSFTAWHRSVGHRPTKVCLLTCPLTDPFAYSAPSLSLCSYRTSRSRSTLLLC